jgi:hypothetical protein
MVRCCLSGVGIMFTYVTHAQELYTNNLQVYSTPRTCVGLVTRASCRDLEIEMAGSGGHRMQHPPARFLHRLHHKNLGKTGTGNHQGSSHVIRENTSISRSFPDACFSFSRRRADDTPGLCRPLKISTPNSLQGRKDGKQTVDNHGAAFLPITLVDAAQLTTVTLPPNVFMHE